MFEKDIEKKIVNACAKRGVKCVKGNPTNKRGFPDLIIFNNIVKEIHWLENKLGSYYGQTPTQRKWQKIIEDSGGKYFLIRDIEEANAYIEKYLKI